jgi:hypothetical protein
MYFRGVQDKNHYIQLSSDAAVNTPELIGYNEVAIGNRTDKKSLVIDKDGIKTKQIILGTNNYIKNSTEPDIDGIEIVGNEGISLGTITNKKALIVDSNGIKTNDKESFDEPLTEFQKLIATKVPYAIYRASDYIRNYTVVSDSQDNYTNTLPEARGKFTASTLGVTLENEQGNGSDVSIPYLIGTAESRITFFINVPINFTMCSITRYTGDDNRRRTISAKEQGNFLHGHWNNRRRITYAEKFLTNSGIINNGDGDDSDEDMTKWLVMCSKNNANGQSINNDILADGISVGSSTNGKGGQQFLNINRDEPSDFAFNQLIVFDTVLTDDEMKIVSDYLQKYLRDGIVEIAHLNDIKQIEANRKIKFGFKDNNSLIHMGENGITLGTKTLLIQKHYSWYKKLEHQRRRHNKH